MTLTVGLTVGVVVQPLSVVATIALLNNIAPNVADLLNSGAKRLLVVICLFTCRLLTGVLAFKVLIGSEDITISYYLSIFSSCFHDERVNLKNIPVNCN